MKKLFAILLLLVLAISLASCRPSDKKRRTYVENHSEMSAEVKQAILDMKVIPGMTKRQLLASWGPPLQKHVWNRGTDNYKEEYTYDHKSDPGERGQVTIVTLLNGKVTSVGQPGLGMYDENGDPVKK